MNFEKYFAHLWANDWDPFRILFSVCGNNHFCYIGTTDNLKVYEISGVFVCYLFNAKYLVVI